MHTQLPIIQPTSFRLNAEHGSDHTMPSLKREASTRSTFTFRVAFDDIQSIQTELLEFTEVIQKDAKSIDKAQTAIHKSIREMEALDRKIASRRKTLEKLRGKDRAHSGRGKG